MILVTLSGQLKALRHQRGLTQKELAGHLSLSPSTIAMYETDEREPDFETVRRIAAFFNVSTDYLLDTQLSTNSRGKGAAKVHRLDLETLPILGRIKAGVPLLSEEHVVGHIEVPSHLKRRAEFALEVTGDSMIGTGLQPGDIVFLRTASRSQPTHGSIVAAMIDQGEMTLKRYIKRGGKFYLHAENSNYPDIPVDARVHIQGVYVGRYSEFEGVVEPPVEDMTEDELITKLAQIRGLDPDQVAGMLDVLSRKRR